jgi:hypothetical protein
MAKWLFVLAVCSLACSAEPPIALDDFGSARLDATCHHLVACGQLSSIDDCHQFYPLLDGAANASFRAALDMGKVTYDGNSARRCVDAIAGQTCEVTGDSLRQPDACWAAIRGTVPADGACAFDAECISQACIVSPCDQACCTGTCGGDRARGSGKTDDACSVDDECQIGLYCASGTCAPLLAAGDVCASSGSCADGLACRDVCTVLPGLGEICDGACRDIGAFCSLGKCVKLALVGDLCGPDNECSGYYVCDATSHCSLPPGIPVGAMCQVGDRCGPGAICVPEDGGIIGLCKQLVPEGAACDELHICASQAGCNATTNTCDPDPVCL